MIHDLKLDDQSYPIKEKTLFIMKKNLNLRKIIL